jgi:hypothetical protein
MEDAVGHVLYVPVHRLGAGDFDFVLYVEQVRLDEHAAGIEVGNVVGAEAVTVEFGLERSGGEGPNAILALGHGLRVRTFKVE